MKFNHLQAVRSHLLLLALGMFPVLMFAQQGVSYREFSAPQRTSGVQEDLPCAGSEIFFEDFQNGLPAGWTIVDGDTLTPNPQTGLGKGWQLLQDYDDTTNLVMVSPSWYVNVGQSDDWLITPQINLGSNSCLSWTARSQDPFFREGYEVRISTGNTDTSAFLSNPALVDVSLENGDNTIRSVNLSDYANQSVYLAFRQTSDDKFVLVLDDVKVSNVNNLDIGVVDMTYGSPQPGDTVRFTFEMGNFGSDTVSSFNMIYSVDGGTPQSMSVDSVSLAPNATISVEHLVFFISDSVDKFYDVCAWTSLPNGSTDEDLSNDTLCLDVPVGSPVGRPEPALSLADLRIFPNPFSDELQIRIGDMAGSMDAEVRVLDLRGREMYRGEQKLTSNIQFSLPLGDLPRGAYLLQIVEGERLLAVRRLLRL